MTGRVFSIEEFSTFNGPGIRATVFLKGCPMHCEWCHSPEGQHFENELLKAQNGCTDCGSCEKYDDPDEKLRHCPNRLLRRCAEDLTPEQLFARLKPNLDILNASGGGVTFSGGEPLAQPEFLAGSLHLLCGKTHRALQTSGFAPEAVFTEILRECDYILYDLKLMDDNAHRHYTGQSVLPILRNFDVLAQSGVPFVIRTPLIPSVTDSKENLTAVAALLQSRNVRSIELLPYNRFAGAKYKAVGRAYLPCFDESLPPQARQELFAAHNITARVL